MVVIVFEGVDGVGKTTHIQRLKDRLSVEFPNNPILTFSAPSREVKEELATGISGEKYNKLIKNDSRTLILKMIKEYFKKQECRSCKPIVLLDRSYVISTYAYVWLYGVTNADIQKLFKDMIMIKPDVIVYMRPSSGEFSDNIYSVDVLTKVLDRYDNFFSFARFKDSIFTVVVQMEKRFDIDTNSSIIFDIVRPIVELKIDNPLTIGSPFTVLFKNREENELLFKDEQELEVKQ